MTLGPLMLDVEGLALTDADRNRLGNPLVGAVILFSRNFAGLEQLKSLVVEIRALRSPPLLVAVDQEGGRVQRFRQGFFPLPPLHWLGHQFDLDPQRGRRLAHACGWLMAAEVLDTGVDFSFAPVVDLDYGTSEIIGDRSFHRDPLVVADLAASYIQGMHRAGMIAVAKHFPGHGFVVADSHLDLPVDPRTLGGLYDDLLPYERLISQEPDGLRLDGVMIAHIRYPQVDNRVASLSSYWLKTVLRGELGYTGVIFSDDLSMRALAAEGDMPVRARLALDAGADMALICNAPADADATLEALRGYQNPAGQARLVTLRARAGVNREPAGRAGAVRGSPDWRETVALLEEALARPGLTLS
ncbi:MAG: beta-N-acetylhexosaminidase [Gammaproteobacteria bacterium]|nr:beta-N-acetylhexosaminidase [Gammaproteobacteria bacterium]